MPFYASFFPTDKDRPGIIPCQESSDRPQSQTHSPCWQITSVKVTQVSTRAWGQEQEAQPNGLGVLGLAGWEAGKFIDPTYYRGPLVTLYPNYSMLPDSSTCRIQNPVQEHVLCISILDTFAGRGVAPQGNVDVGHAHQIELCSEPSHNETCHGNLLGNSFHTVPTHGKSKRWNSKTGWNWK